MEPAKFARPENRNLENQNYVKVDEINKLKAIHTGCFDTLDPPSTADLGIGTYENCMFSGPYINSRLPCKFSEL